MPGPWHWTGPCVICGSSSENPARMPCRCPPTPAAPVSPPTAPLPRRICTTSPPPCPMVAPGTRPNCTRSRSSRTTRQSCGSSGPSMPRTLIDPPPTGQPAPRVEVEVAARDDYRVGEAHLVATVAKGSGEAVKFHEQKLSFDVNAIPTRRTRTAACLRRTLDFGDARSGAERRTLFLRRGARQPPAHPEPHPLGDALPRAQRAGGSRAHRRQGALRRASTSCRNTSAASGRSSSTRKSSSPTGRIFPTHELRQRANDLGGDQQLLRLRYGQFLGEETGGTAPPTTTRLSLNPLQATPPPR